MERHVSLSEGLGQFRDFSVLLKTFQRGWLQSQTSSHSRGTTATLARTGSENCAVFRVESHHDFSRQGGDAEDPGHPNAASWLVQSAAREEGKTKNREPYPQIASSKVFVSSDKADRWLQNSRYARRSTGMPTSCSRARNQTSHVSKRQRKGSKRRAPTVRSHSGIASGSNVIQRRNGQQGS